MPSTVPDGYPHLPEFVPLVQQMTGLRLSSAVTQWVVVVVHVPPTGTWDAKAGEARADTINGVAQPIVAARFRKTRRLVSSRMSLVSSIGPIYSRNSAISIDQSALRAHGHPPASSSEA